MVDANKEVTIVIVSHKSKEKVISLINKISNKHKIIIVENSHNQSIKEDLSNLKNIKLIPCIKQTILLYLK